MISTRTGGRRVARRKCDVAAGHSELIYARRFGGRRPRVRRGTGRERSSVSGRFRPPTGNDAMKAIHQHSVTTRWCFQ
ncbi:hypothetical protein EVAR_100748_1 [Eumeta japonica]|uniref:Uncharacterized protein n=1 Tax=Eumeta variegata TaxID=151549 RepID=A0A4C1Z6M9_EUMVA|nr:hypothetical protein EVAR_100748_1 [Eumeta japonica]